MNTAAIKIGLLSFVLALAFSLAGVWLIGPNLGGAFWIVTVASLISPIAASSGRDALTSAIAGIFAAFGAASIALLLLDAFSSEQIVSIVVAAIAMGLAATSLARLLAMARVVPPLAGAIVSILSLAWLSWPVWLSPWLTGTGSSATATRLASIHPLMSINADVTQFGYWTQSTHIYRYTTLGQDVQFSLPAGVARCVIFHLILAVMAGLPMLLAWWVARRRSAPSPAI